MMPSNPWEFVQSKLRYLQEQGDSIYIEWYVIRQNCTCICMYLICTHYAADIRDMFVDESMRPKLWRRGMLDSLFDDTDLV